MEEIKQKRLVAYKLMIKDIVNGSYVKGEEWNPNYVILADGKKISRVNIIGTIIDKQNEGTPNQGAVVMDDGSAKISLRTFEENKILEKYDIGDSVLVVGKPREFGNEKYIIPEIIKRIGDKNWIELRKKELSKNKNEEKNKIEVYDVKEEAISYDHSIISIIKQLDKGDGADFNEIVNISKDQNAEKIINNMLKLGELFEIKPGKIKILE